MPRKPVYGENDWKGSEAVSSEDVLSIRGHGVYMWLRAQATVVGHTPVKERKSVISQKYISGVNMYGLLGYSFVFGRAYDDRGSVTGRLSAASAFMTPCSGCFFRYAVYASFCCPEECYDIVDMYVVHNTRVCRTPSGWNRFLVDENDREGSEAVYSKGILYVRVM